MSFKAVAHRKHWHRLRPHGFELALEIFYVADTKNIWEKFKMGPQFDEINPKAHWLGQRDKQVHLKESTNSFSFWHLPSETEYQINKSISSCEIKEFALSLPRPIEKFITSQ